VSRLVTEPRVIVDRPGVDAAKVVLIAVDAPDPGWSDRLNARVMPLGGLVGYVPNNQLYVTDWTNTFRSTDGGATFTPFLTGYNNIKWDPSRPETAYLWRAYSRPERTLSSGTHIGTFSDGLPQTGELRGHFAIDANGTTVYTTVSFKGIYRITD
jgi:hypothetical protein